MAGSALFLLVLFCFGVVFNGRAVIRRSLTQIPVLTRQRKVTR